MIDGELIGLFKATKEEVNNLVGKHLCFGEVLGKHSYVEGCVEDGEITLVSDNPLVVVDTKEIGYNPLRYIDNEEDGRRLKIY